MTTLAEQAQEYTSKKTQNIADLDSVSVTTDIREEEFTKKDGETFKQNIITVDDVDYRVPVSVIKNLKVLLEQKPKMTHFKVIKLGSTKDDTTYTVMDI